MVFMCLLWCGCVGGCVGGRGEVVISLTNVALLIGDIKGFGCLYSPLLVDVSAETDVDHCER